MRDQVKAVQEEISSAFYEEKSLPSFSVKELPIDEQPRERLMTHGAKTLSDAELLAVLLRTGTQKYNAVELARLMLKDRNGLTALSKCRWEDLKNWSGIGKVKALTLEAVFELSRRLNAKTQPLVQFAQPSDLNDYFGPLLRDLGYEVFIVVLANNANRIISHKEIAKGTKSATLVDIQEVIKLALLHNATSIVLIHNHPSGNPAISAADKQLTKKITEAASYFSLTVLDHLIIAGHDYVSFRDNGLLV
jgi:DNA repair protein RadC